MYSLSYWGSKHNKVPLLPSQIKNNDSLIHNHPPTDRHAPQATKWIKRVPTPHSRTPSTILSRDHHHHQQQQQENGSSECIVSGGSLNQSPPTSHHTNEMESLCILPCPSMLPPHPPPLPIPIYIVLSTLKLSFALRVLPITLVHMMMDGLYTLGIIIIINAR